MIITTKIRIPATLLTVLSGVQKKGKKIPQTYVTFTTKTSTDTTAKDYIIDGTYLTEDLHVELAYNSYGPNMQLSLNIRNMFNHNTLKVGDTVTFNFDIIPDSDLPPIMVNVVDDSSDADYRLPLAADSEGVGVSYKLTEEPMKEGNTYPVSLTFKITNNQKRNCVLVFTSSDYDNDGVNDETKYDGDIGFTIKAVTE